jgi:hypothetical protein
MYTEEMSALVFDRHASIERLFYAAVRVSYIPHDLGSLHWFHQGQGVDAVSTCNCQIAMNVGSVRLIDSKMR